MPRSVQGLHREGVVHLPRADAGVVSPVIMNVRAGDASELVARLRELVTMIAGGGQGAWSSRVPS